MFKKRSITSEEEKNFLFIPENRSTDISWTHDETGEAYKLYATIEEKHPEYALQWVEGIYGGYIFEVPKPFNITLKTIEGVRGIGYKAICAFDKEGNGWVFMK